MTDIYLRFIDNEQMITVLQPLGMIYVDQDTISSIIPNTHQYAAWVIGEMLGYDGYHLNLRVIDDSFDVSSLTEYEVHPQQPKVVWA